MSIELTRNRSRYDYSNDYWYEHPSYCDLDVQFNKPNVIVTVCPESLPYSWVVKNSAEKQNIENLPDIFDLFLVEEGSIGSLTKEDLMDSTDYQHEFDNDNESTSNGDL